MKKGNSIQGNLIPLSFLLWLISFNLGLLFLLSENALAQSENASSNIFGYYEGEFMPGNNLTLILHFQKSDDGETAGNILLFQGDSKIQDDPLSDIQFDGKQLNFSIETKNTPFKGVLSGDGQQISGEFQFPDNSVHAVLVTRVEKPSKGYTSGEEKRGDVLTQQYSVSQLQTDFNFLREHLEQTHPQLYLYTSKDEFDRFFDSTYATIQHEMTGEEFFRLIAPVIEKVHCCHTGIRPSKAYGERMKQSPAFLPLDIQFVDGKAYVITDYGQYLSVEKGIQVVSINGQPFKEILNRLMSCIPADGHNKTAKLFETNTNFSRVYSLYIGRFAQFQLECLQADDKKVTCTVPAFTGDELEAAEKKFHTDRFPGGALPLSLNINAMSSTAILKISGFWAPNPDDYIAFLQNSFDEIRSKNIRHLIIDVRSNKGGHPFFGAELLSYLAKSDFIYFEQPEEQPEIAPLYHPWPVKENAFNGDVYVLMNGGCLSTTGHFLSLVRYHKLGTLIGEESGGSFYCNDGSIQLTLPETGIQLNLPGVTFQTAVSGFKKGEPLLPDHKIAPTLDDLLNGKDAVMEYTLRLIKN